jgi:hypothetical protein
MKKIVALVIIGLLANSLVPALPAAAPLPFHAPRSGLCMPFQVLSSLLTTTNPLAPMLAAPRGTDDSGAAGDADLICVAGGASPVRGEALDCGEASSFFSSGGRGAPCLVAPARSPGARDGTLFLIFLLAYLITLAASNLPWAFPFYDTLRPGPTNSGRVFIFPGLPGTGGEGPL